MKCHFCPADAALYPLFRMGEREALMESAVCAPCAISHAIKDYLPPGGWDKILTLAAMLGAALPTMVFTEIHSPLAQIHLAARRQHASRSN